MIDNEQDIEPCRWADRSVVSNYSEGESVILRHSEYHDPCVIKRLDGDQAFVVGEGFGLWIGVNDGPADYLWLEKRESI